MGQFVNGAIVKGVAKYPDGSKYEGEFEFGKPKKKNEDQIEIKKGYRILELDTYFTSGPEETKAWTIQKNCTAPKAAGEIHTDFEKGFIRAETVAFNDFIENQGWVNSKTKGKMRLEGKEYIVKDGDVLNFRFNT